MFDFNDTRYDKFEEKVWLSSPTMHGEEKDYILEAYDTNWMSTVGKNIDEIERMMAEKVGCKHAVGLATGTASLHLAIKLAAQKMYDFSDISKGALAGKRVFCSDLTFCATINPIVYEGGTPVFIDSEYDTWNMDPKALEKAFEIYPDVKIVVVVNLYGVPAKLDEIRKIADAHGAVVVEDAAESLGATYMGKQTGSFGDYNCISFNGNKIITGSAGGMFLTNNLDDANKVKKLSTQARENAAWYQHEEIGYNYRISNVVAGVVRGQIPHLDEHIAQKKAIYERYKEGFKDLPIKMNPFDEDKSKPNFWLSCLIIDEGAMCGHTRGEHEAVYKPEHGKTCPTEVLDAIRSINAEGRPIWKPLSQQPVFRGCDIITAEGSIRAVTDAYLAGYCKSIATDIFDRGVCLPSDNKMTEEEQDRVIEIVRACFE